MKSCLRITAVVVTETSLSLYHEVTKNTENTKIFWDAIRFVTFAIFVSS